MAWPARVDAPPMWLGSTCQVPGLFPFTTPSGTPLVGVPLGPNLVNGSIVCFDPLSWFKAGLLSNPSIFVLSTPGRGKSTLVRRMVTGLAGFGVLPLVLGDLKPDYVDLIGALGGQVVSLGPERGCLNVLDAREANDAARRLVAAGRGDLARQVRGDYLDRRVSVVESLVAISRAGKVSDRESTVLQRAVEVLDEKVCDPVLADLLAVIKNPPEAVLDVAAVDGDVAQYRKVFRDLEASLTGLVAGGRLGRFFSGHTDEPMRRDLPVCYDISSIPEGRNDMAAAALMACWSTGFGVVNIAHALADAGLEPDRQYFVVMDEMWRALRAGSGMVDRIDTLSRLNRQLGVAEAMLSHTPSDLVSMLDEADKAKARGLISRSGAVVLGAMPREDMPLLSDAVELKPNEQETLIGWSGRSGWGTRPGTGVAPGLGQFMVKVGGRPGITFRTVLTDEERDLNDTNRRWHEQSRIGATRR